MFALTLSIGAWAQGGVFQRGEESVEFQNGSAAILTNQGFGITQGNLTNQGFGGANGGITNQTFGAPIGNGLFVLLAAGAGYATLKTKKRKSNH